MELNDFIAIAMDPVSGAALRFKVSSCYTNIQQHR